jgi:hypothetical protein
MHRFLTGLVAAGALVAVGCDDGNDIVRRTSNDISISPQQIFFPRVVAPQFNVQTVEIQHAGIDPLTIRQVFIEGFEECSRAELGFSEADQLPEDVKARCPVIIDVMPELPITLEDQQFETVNIRFQPVDSTVPDALRLVVESNALDKNLQYVDIGFQRAQPQIAAENVVSFQAGVQATEFLIVSNIGSGPLTVQAPTLSLISEPAINEATGQPVDEFRISAITPFPWTVEESRSETLDIEYTPFDGNRDTAELTFMSSDPETPSFVVTLTSAPVFGILNVDPNPVSFAVPSIGGMTEKVITLNNAGVRYIDINGITIDQPEGHYRLAGDGQDSFRIQGGGSRDITIAYQPPGNTSSSATLNIRYDDGNDATPDTIAVPMAPEGEALPPVLNIDPVSLAMDDVALGETREAMITLTNSGGAALNISAIRLSEDGDPTVATDPEFMIVSGGEAVDLDPGASHTVTISLTRAEDDALVHVGALIIESNAASSPDVVQFTSNPPQE